MITCYRSLKFYPYPGLLAYDMGSRTGLVEVTSEGL